MKPQISKWEVTDYLKTEEEQAMYLNACIEEADGDAAFIAKALGDIARARGMTQIANDTGLSRESLYKALSLEGNPTFATVLKVMNALELNIQAVKKPPVEIIGISELQSKIHSINEQLLAISALAQDISSYNYQSTSDIVDVQRELGEFWTSIYEKGTILSGKFEIAIASASKDKKLVSH